MSSGPQAGSADTPAPDTRRKPMVNCLIVDDDPGIRSLLQAYRHDLLGATGVGGVGCVEANAMKPCRHRPHARLRARAPTCARTEPRPATDVPCP